MPGPTRKSRQTGGAYLFRVSDVVDVPLRGTVLRLRLVEGTPAMADLRSGQRLRLEAPDGVTRDVTVTGHAVTGGRPTQKRLDRTREVDVIITDAQALAAAPVEIGWFARGPVS